MTAIAAAPRRPASRAIAAPIPLPAPVIANYTSLDSHFFTSLPIDSTRPTCRSAPHLRSDSSWQHFKRPTPDSGPTRDPVHAVWRDVRESICGKKAGQYFSALACFRFGGPGSWICQQAAATTGLPHGMSSLAPAQMAEPALPRDRPDSRMYRRIRGNVSPTVRPISRITSPRRGVLRLIAIELQPLPATRSLRLPSACGQPGLPARP
jgi:hypothetical protein